MEQSELVTMSVSRAVVQRYMNDSIDFPRIVLCVIRLYEIGSPGPHRLNPMCSGLCRIIRLMKRQAPHDHDPCYERECHDKLLESRFQHLCKMRSAVRLTCTVTGSPCSFGRRVRAKA
jgi:hypothetical protein